MDETHYPQEQHSVVFQDETRFISMLQTKVMEFPWLHRNIVDTEGWGLMHRATVFGMPEDVRMLIQSGVDPFQPIEKIDIRSC